MIGERIGMCSLPVELLFRQLRPATIFVGFAIDLTLLTLVQGRISHVDIFLSKGLNLRSIERILHLDVQVVGR